VILLGSPGVNPGLVRGGYRPTDLGGRRQPRRRLSSTARMTSEQLLNLGSLALGQHGLPGQTASNARGLVLVEVAFAGLASGDLARAGHLETLLRPGVALHLGHG